MKYNLAEAIPTKQLVSESKYNANKRAIEGICSILKINSVIQESKEDFIKEYEDKLAEAKKKMNALVNENIQLKESFGKKQAELILESKLANVASPAERNFIKAYFKGADADMICEQFEFAKKNFRQIIESKREDAKELNAPMKSPSSFIAREPEKAPAAVIKESTDKSGTAAKKIQPVQAVPEKPAKKQDNKSISEIYAEILKDF